MDEEQARRIGARVRSARRRRGLPLRKLAELSGVSAGFLSMVENGHRLLDRASHIAALAEALRISPAELVGQPRIATAAGTASAHEAIPDIRLALMGLDLPLVQPSPTTTANDFAAQVAEANRLYHAAEYGTLAGKLPNLLSGLHAAADAATGRARRQLLRTLVDAYHPACALLLKNLGYTDLAFVAVTRAADVIDELDDPVYAALSGFFRTHVLMSAGSPEQALAQATAATSTLERNLTKPSAHALLGELHLISATSITHDKRRPGASRASEVEEHLREADRLARLTGETRAWHLNFGPTNVGIHQVSLNTDLKRHGEAVTASRKVQLGELDVPGRQAAFHADLGRSLAHLRGREADAVAALLAAERIAPQRVHANALVSEVIGYLTDRQLPFSTARDLRGLAHRMDVPL